MGLNVYSQDRLAGHLDMKANEQFYGFTYDEGYLEADDAEPLSLSLPLRRARFNGAESLPFFEGLLPEGDVRASIARQLGVSASSPAKLLRALGKDCAGDVAVLEEDDPYQPPANDRYLPLPGGLERLSEDPLPEIAQLRADNRLSLAGGQEKIALYHDEREPIESGWYVPVEGSPSTHIVKPQSQDRYPLLALNEHLCMRLAGRAQIATAETEYLELDTPLLVIRRYDREGTGKSTDEGLAIVRRLRQEDACQALGYPSSKKYQQDGGPGIRELNRLLLAHSAGYLADQRALARLVVFNYLIGNCDAHAKNFSLLLGNNGAVRLAPAYDLVATSVYGEGFGTPLSRTMGMRIGGHANLDRVTADDLVLLSEDLGMSEALFTSIASQVTSDLEEGLVEVADSFCRSADDADAAAELLQRIRDGLSARAALF